MALYKLGEPLTMGVMTKKSLLTVNATVVDYANTVLRFDSL